MSSSLRKAFDHADAIKRLPDRLRAGALCASYRQLLIGSTEGTLLNFGRNARGSGSSRGFSSDEQFMSEIARYRRFAPEKQPILALIAVPSWNPKDGGLLLALSPASITAHALGRLQSEGGSASPANASQTLIASLPCSKGCHLLAVLESTSLLVAAGTHKGSSVLEATLWNGSHFLQYQSYSLPEPPLVLTAAGRKGDVVCIAFRREFRLLDVHTGASTVITDGGGGDADVAPAALVVPATPPRRPQEELLLTSGAGGRRGHFFSVSASSDTGGGGDGPGGAGAGGAGGGAGSSAGAHRAFMSRPADEHIEWSGSPAALAYSHPFVLAALPRRQRIEVHNVATCAVVQYVDVRSMHAGSALSFLAPARDRTDVVFASTPDAVVRLRLRSVHEQVHVCLAAGQFEEALSLCELCPDMAGVDEAARCTIHEQYAYELWDRGDIREATSQFGLARTPILKVLALFPELLLPGEGEHGSAGAMGSGGSSWGLGLGGNAKTKGSTRAPAAAAASIGAPELALLPPAQARAARAAVAREAERRGATPTLSGGAVTSSEDARAGRQSRMALSALCVFLRAARQRLGAGVGHQGHGGGTSISDAIATANAADAAFDELDSTQRLALLDTVLLKAMVLTQGSGPCCDFLLKEAEEAEETDVVATRNDVGTAESDAAKASSEGVEGDDGVLSGGALKAMLAAGRGQKQSRTAIGSGQHCELGPCSAFLRQHSRWDELACLYVSCGHHGDALELFAALADGREGAVDDRAKWHARSVELMQLLSKLLVDDKNKQKRGGGVGGDVGSGDNAKKLSAPERSEMQQLLLKYSPAVLSARPRLGLKLFTGEAVDGSSDRDAAQRGGNDGDDGAASGASIAGGGAVQVELLFRRFMRNEANGLQVPLSVGASSFAIQTLGARRILEHLSSCAVDADVSAAEAVKCTRLDLGGSTRDRDVDSMNGRTGAGVGAGASSVPLVDGRHLSVAFLLKLIEPELCTHESSSTQAATSARRFDAQPPVPPTQQQQQRWFHAELLNLLLDAIHTLLRPDGEGGIGSAGGSSNLKALGHGRAVDESGVLGVLRRVLLRVLRASSSYSPAEVLTRMPPDKLLEERAVLLGRLGQDEDVLLIYAQQMGEPLLAQRYCAERFPEQPDIYLKLLRLLLPRPAQAQAAAQRRQRARQRLCRGLESSRSGFGTGPGELDRHALDELAREAEDVTIYVPALQLLERHYACFDPLEVLEVLDPDLPLQKVAPFFEAVLRSNAERRRNKRVVKQLLKVEALQVQVNLIEEQSKAMHATFCKVLIKINNDQQCRQMTVAEFCEELDTGENGEFEFENVTLQQSAVSTALRALHNQGIFNVRTRDEGFVDGERSHQYEYWLRKRVHGASSSHHHAGVGGRW